MIRLRRSRSLAVVFVGKDVVAFDYVTQKQTRLEDGIGLKLLQGLDDWMEPDAVFGRLAATCDRSIVGTELIRLIDTGIVVVEGSEAAERDAHFASVWEWGLTAGIFHFGIRNTSYESVESLGSWLEHRSTTTPAVDLYRDHAGNPESFVLPPPPHDHGVLSILRARRSRRNFADAPLPIAKLRDCLFGSMAIVGFAEMSGPAPERLPIKMTPSGGARNPYEAYVCARSVEGLAPGVYHYAGVDNSLAPVQGGQLPKLSDLVGAQQWFEHAGALILLVANFRRTMWKYPHPGGLRVVLIEAGHIAQNMLVCAAHHGLAAAPTCAVSDEPLERLLGLDPAEQAVLHAVALGIPSSTACNADFARIVPNAALSGWLQGEGD